MSGWMLARADFGHGVDERAASEAPRANAALDARDVLEDLLNGRLIGQLVDLRLFAQIANTRSITRGAEKASLSLASASARIRGMEVALGVPLLHREPRGVRLTPAGETLLRHAQVMLQQHERMRGELGNFSRGLKGYIKLLSNTIAATEFLPVALAEFLAAHPNVDIELEEHSSEDIVDAVSAGCADAGIIVATTDFGDLRTLPFADDRLVVVVAPGHPLARRRELAFRDLGQFEFVELSSGRALAAFLARQAARAGQTLKVRVRMTSFEAVCQMVQLGAGIAIVPERAARKHRRSMMRVINLTDDWAQRRLLICCRQQDELSDHAKRLVKHLKAPQPA